MPLYSNKTIKTFLDILGEPYVWELLFEASTEEESKALAIQCFKEHVGDYEFAFEDLKSNQVKRILAFKQNVGVEALYYAACGEVRVVEIPMSRRLEGLTKIRMTAI